MIVYELPERAWATCKNGGTINDACRISVAEELRQLVDEIDPSTTGCHREDADRLLARANQLDPDGAS